MSSASESHYGVQLGYYVGVDWLLEGHSALVAAPKLDTRIETIKAVAKPNDEIEIDGAEQTTSDQNQQVTIDYFAILKDCLGTDYLYREIDELVQIDWKAQEIPVTQSQDWLSPLLVVKYLNLLKSIVRKGLKKSYYSVTENLNSKVKGKILVAANVRGNILKNRLTRTVCSYQEFGIDHTENRLLKKAFQFACSYLDNNRRVFESGDEYVTQLIGYCRPAFEQLSNDVSISDMRYYKPNPFFKEYTEGVHLAKLILRRFAYTISNTTQQVVTTPPYWIDMPRLFELYAYSFLKKRFPNKGEVQYHVSTHGNELDFLVNSGDVKMVVDAKYKPLYCFGKDHGDMRQLSG